MTNRESIAGTVGGNIRELRLERAQTLAGLAGRAGISVRTLVEIEGGRANASLATLGAIADALGVDFGRLIRPPESGATRTVAIAGAPVIWSDEQGSEARFVLISRQPQSVELQVWSLRPGGSYRAEPDPAGTDVLIVVARGTLTVTVAEEAIQLTAGTAGQISPGGGYVLAGQGRSATEFTLIHIPPAGARARYTRPESAR